MNDTAELASKELQIPRALGDLDHELDELREAVYKLLDRLEPSVLRPAMPEPSSTPNGNVMKDIEQPAPMTNRIKDAADQLRVIRRRTTEVLSRLEI